MYVEYKTSWEKRALAVMLAVVFVFVGMPYVGVETSFEASAHAAGNGKIIQVPTYSQYMGQSGYTESHGSDGTPNGTYTGKILPQSVNMYDYLTDYEINNSKWNKLSGNESNYTYYARYEPYKQFNRGISTAYSSSNTFTSLSDKNITIEYKTLRYKSSETVYIHYWDSANGNKSTTWPGKKMTFDRTDGGYNVFSYTVNADGCGFTPNSIIFNNGDGVQSDTITQTLVKGKKYVFKDNVTASSKITFCYPKDDSNLGTNTGDVCLYLWTFVGSTKYEIAWRGLKTTYNFEDHNLFYNTGTKKHFYTAEFDTNIYNWLPENYIINWNGGQTGDRTFNETLQAGWTYIITGGGEILKSFPTNSTITLESGTSTAENTTITKSALYQGYFLADTNNDDPRSYTDSRKPENKDNGIFSTNQKYNNFYWQANMAQRLSTSSSITGLVDNTLDDNGLVKQGNVALPYFNSRWSGVSDGLMKCWEGEDEKSISFPFYEVLTDANKVEGDVKNNNLITQKATFYQFNSKDSTVHFIPDNTNPENSYFEERIPAQVDLNGNVNGSLNESIRASNGKVGFFPFNDGRTASTTGEGDSSSEGNEKNGYKNNYGFGSKFEMTFKLSNDGKTNATHDSIGNKLASNVTPAKVNTRFEFNGDDDLWVFIDGNLVLDMGGAHGASYGYIDFAKREVVAQTAVKYGVGSEDYLGLNGGSGITELSGSDFLGAIKNSQNVENNYYNPDTLHTMTIFYMERGMSESNLFIRFNFAAESNYNKLKVKEQTDFSGVNAGLQSLTKLAADNDVFKYKIQNANTNGDYVLQTNTPYPTQGNYVRQITADQENKTKLASATSTSPGSNYLAQSQNKTDFIPKLEV